MWHLASLKRKHGIYYILRRGGRGNRINIILGYLTATDAHRALERANEDPERLVRVWERFGPGSPAWKAWEERRPEYEAKVRNMPPEQRETVEDGPPGIDVIGWLLDHDEPDGPDWARISLREFGEGLFSERRPKKVEPGTWANEKRRLKTMLDGIGSWRLRDFELDPDGVRRRWERYLDGRDTRPNTKRLEQALLVAILKMAEKEGAFRRRLDYRDLFEPVKVKESDMLPVEPLTRDEVKRILDAAEPMYRAAFALGFGAGLRPSEIVGQRWEHVFWDRQMMRPTTGTKTARSSHVIALTRPAYRELRAWWEACGRPKSGPCFPDPRPGHQTRPLQSLRSGWQRAVEASGILDEQPGRRAHLYAMRHTFTVDAAVSGVHPSVTQATMRHTTSRTTMDIYSRVGALHLAEGLAPFPDWLDEDEAVEG